VDLPELLDALQLNHNDILDCQIYSVTKVDGYPIVNNGLRNLIFNVKPASTIRAQNRPRRRL
jgi:hypothetical protein